MNVIQIVSLYILSVNLGGFIAFFIDKRRSTRSKWRIPEATLLTFALLGGSIGCLLAMKTFRHKTLKPLFSIGIPVILTIQIVALLVFFFIMPFSFMIQ
ncbi:MAG: DUF1294 domain-containing protein [Lachnospiraceae bacterium]|nr:DUF1294 domain-containing protein [Lachnospiraceae bacterium]